jgi:hypothetical protein
MPALVRLVSKEEPPVAPIGSSAPIPALRSFHLLSAGRCVLRTHILLRDLDNNSQISQVVDQGITVKVQLPITVGLPGTIWTPWFFENAMLAGSDLERAFTINLQVQ